MPRTAGKRPDPGRRRATRGIAIALVCGLAFAMVGGAPARGVEAGLSAEDEADLARVEVYLNGIRTLAGRFVQIAPNGAVSGGRIYLRRPGRLRFEYEPPTPILIVADGIWLVFYDSELGQVTRLPLSATPLGILVEDQIRLRGRTAVRRVDRQPGSLRITLFDPERPDQGTLTLVLGDRPLVLRSWVVTDAQGLETAVALLNVKANVKLDPKLFVFIEPQSSDDD